MPRVGLESLLSSASEYLPPQKVLQTSGPPNRIMRAEGNELDATADEPRTEQAGDLHPSILVAEDDLATRALLRVALERARYTVRALDNGADALAEILRSPPDVALLDIGMPEMDGLEVTRNLRRNPATAHLPIILVTARGRPEDVEAGRDAGATDFVVKPFAPADLLERVRAHLPSEIGT